MIVCHCHLVTDATLRELVASGESVHLEALAEQCGAATKCGGCVDGIEALLERWGADLSAPAEMGAH